MLTSIIIPTSGRIQALRKCLQGIQNQSQAPDEIIIVDDSLKKINLSEVKIISSPGFVGASEAKNLGAREAKGEIIIFLDDDCVPSKNWLASLVNFFKKNPKINLVVGRVIETRLFSQKGQFSDILLNLPFYPLYLLSRHPQGGTIYPNGRVDLNSSSRQSGFCDWGGAGNFAIKRNLFQKLQGFDQNLLPGSHCEEPDLCFRAQKKGQKIFYLGQASVIHDRSPLLRPSFYSSIINLRANEVYFALKNTVPLSLLNAFLFFIYQAWQTLIYLFLGIFDYRYFWRIQGKIKGFKHYYAQKNRH